MKECKKHGQLNEDQLRKYVRSRRGRTENVTACKLCHRETASKARNANREKANAWGRDHRKRFPEKYKEWAKNYKKKNWQKISVSDSLRYLNLTNEQYNEMIDKQNGKCGICFSEETRIGRGGELARLCIDHDHETGKIRELLCHGCNTGLGKFKDNIELMKNAILYLEKHQCN